MCVLVYCVCVDGVVLLFGFSPSHFSICLCDLLDLQLDPENVEALVALGILDLHANDG